MNNNSSKQILLSVIGVAILVIAVVGVSFAFFSFVNQGTTANTVETGTIIFKASATKVELTNAFPTTADGAEVLATVAIEGSTTYKEGIEFEVIAKNVRSSNNDIIPTIVVETETVNGVSYTDTFDAATETFGNNTVSVKGEIAGSTEETTVNIPQNTKVLTVKAYYDRAKYHITDQTYAQIAPIRPDYVTEDTTLVSQSDWNAMNADENGAYSFTIDIYAVEGGTTRLPY